MEKERKYKFILMKGIPKDLYWRIKKIRARLEANSWRDFLYKIAPILENYLESLEEET